jgi:hypothetical protein
MAMTGLIPRVDLRRLLSCINIITGAMVLLPLKILLRRTVMYFQRFLTLIFMDDIFHNSCLWMDAIMPLDERDLKQ